MPNKKKKGDNNNKKKTEQDSLVGTPVDFLYKTMIERDPRKRKVKPVDHKNFESFHLLEDTSSDDSDYKPKNEKDDGEDDDVDLEEDEDEEQPDTGSSDNEDTVAQRKGQPNGLMSQPPKAEAAASHNALACLSPGAEWHRTCDRFSSIHICAVCCGDCSQDSDEIVECDSCAITVHENCYGIVANEADNESLHSNVSSCSTEPWFCDACKAGVRDMACELCPNQGGIFKQTDAGRWVHVVCALYVTGVAFSDTIHLTGITLFELTPDRWGAKSCCLCEDERFARTGITICCDAGLCRTFFHVTCAQREGLLQEVQDLSQETEAVDPFIAHCKIHASDKHIVKAKKRNFLSLQSRMRFKRGSQTSLSTRTNKKLDMARQRWRTRVEMERKVQVPIRKVARSLTTSPAAVRILMKKADLMGFSSMNHSQDGVGDIRKKWHVAPAFSVEFVSYYIDRGIRISSMRTKLQELQAQEASLKREEADVLKSMNDVMPQYDSLKKSSLELREKARRLWTKLLAVGRDESAHLPEVFESPAKDSRKTVSSNSSGRRGSLLAAAKTSLSQELDWKECGLCRKSVDQHLLALCDSCKLHFHLYCLDPPLTRMPKKTRFGGWQCSDCTDKQKKQQQESDVELDEEEEHNDDGSARKRTRRGPDKYVPDADKFAASTAPTATQKRRGRPPLTEKKKRMKMIAKQRALNRMS